MGGSIVKGPFTWVNQGCWLGYFLSVVATVLLVSWDVVVWPVRDLSRLNKVRSLPGLAVWEGRMGTNWARVRWPAAEGFAFLGFRWGALESLGVLALLGGRGEV